MANAQKVDGNTAIARVDAVVRDVFAGVAVLCGLVEELYARAESQGRLPTTGDLAAIRPTLLDHLARGDPPLAGTGVIAAPNALADQPRWLEWWRTPVGGSGPCPLTVDLDPQSIGGYEYTSAEWFSAPLRSGEPVVVGPYVDYAGTDEYILTFASPIKSGDRFLGVAAADIRAGDFERAMFPILDAVGPGSALVNGFGRVIASNTPDVILGSLLPADRGHRSTTLDCAPWTLVTI